MRDELADSGFDAVIIGAGVVGTAIAAALSARHHSVLVIERARQEATGITGRNSGVVHSGLYYPKNSLRAQTCIRGQELLYAWCERQAVPFARLGKLVIARGDAEARALEKLHANALASGVRDLRRISSAEIATLEPALPPCDAALFSPNTGIVDAHALARSLRAAAERKGAVFAMGTRVDRLTAITTGIRVQSGEQSLVARTLINAAGLDADRLAATIGVRGFPIFPCRGDYFRLQGARDRYRHLIYPVRSAAATGLGVHLTLGLDGSVRLGPDAEYVDDREDFSPAPHKRSDFLRAAQRLLGPIDGERLHYESCGIRPKLRPPGDDHERDFVILEEPAGCVHLLGIESPGLTAALAIGERIALSFSCS